MTEVTNEIVPQTNKLYKCNFQFSIDKFLHKLNTVSRLDFEISGLTTCHLEVHPSQPKPSQLGFRYTKLVFRMDPPKYTVKQPREVQFEIRATQDIAIWGSKFNYESGSHESSKEEFMNHLYLKSYMEEETLVLTGIIVVKEMDWKQANDPMQMISTRQDKLIKDIHSLASSAALSDFKFIVEGRVLEVHKAILAARSPVFERMFTGNFREATAKEQEIKDVSADTFEEFLYFIYAGDLRNKDFPVDELIAVADRYQVLDLLRYCEVKLLKTINDNNAEKIFRLAHKIHSTSDELKKIAFDVLQSNFKRLTVELPPEFIDLPEMLFRSLHLKKKLEASLKIDSESEGTSDDSDEVVLTESISSFSPGKLSELETLSLPSLETSVSIQSNDDHIIQLLQDQ